MILKRVRNNSRALSLVAALTAPGLLISCSSGTQQPGAPLPSAPVPSNATAYIGSQAPGNWALTVDDTQNVFSYQNLAGSATASGGMLNTNGVLDFGNKDGVALGKAVEQPGVGALLRPGGAATFPVAMVRQSDCVPITGKLRYIYAALPGPVPQNGNSGATSTGFGTFVLSSSTDGKSLSFTDVHSYVVTSLQGGAVSADTEDGRDPVLFSATCASTNGVGSVTADPTAAFAAGTSGSVASPTFHFNAAGAVSEDRATNLDGGWIGFAMPTTAIKPSGVATGTYRGFFSESTDKITVETEPVAFARATDGSTNLLGGAFPTDDLTQTPGSEYTISLGSPDATYGGIFPNARFIAADTNGLCASVAVNDPTVQSSFDENGGIICTAAGVAVVSQVNGKYVIYFTSHDGTMSTSNQSFLIQFYLYQQ